MKKDLSHISISSNNTNYDMKDIISIIAGVTANASDRNQLVDLRLDVYDNGERFHLVIKTETEENRKLEISRSSYY